MTVRQAPPKPGGIYAALATPRRPNSIAADTSALFDYLDVVAKAGVDGFVLFGATGEFVHFDTGQRTLVASLAIKRSRVPVLVNVSHSTLDGAIALGQAAAEHGASGVMLMPPYFYHYPDRDIFAYYARFFEALGGRIPVYLYNLPIFTNPLSAELATRLLTEMPFAGVKDSSGEWDSFEMLRRARAQRDFRLLAGHEKIYPRARVSGADGVISGVAAAMPELMVALDRAILAGKQERAAQLDGYVHEMLAWLGRFPATVGIKQAAVARGWKQDHFAAPADPALLSEYRAWLSGWIPRVLAACAPEALKKSGTH
jgi:dihydrodipicolinate synthase/N-acetylneuraminate lyase